MANIFPWRPLFLVISLKVVDIFAALFLLSFLIFFHYRQLLMLSVLFFL